MRTHGRRLYRLSNEGNDANAVKMSVSSMSAAALYVVLQDREDKLWFNEAIGRNATSAYDIPTARLLEILFRAALRFRSCGSSVGRNGDPHAAYFPRGIPFGSLRRLPQSISWFTSASCVVDMAISDISVETSSENLQSWLTT